MKKNKLRFLKYSVIIFGFILIFLAFSVLNMQDQNKVEFKPKLIRDFEEVGKFQNNRYLVYYTYFVKQPTKEKIQKFWKYMKKVYRSDCDLLKINFYEKKESTPDITVNLFFHPDTEKYLIAKAHFNFKTGGEKLEFLKLE